MDDKGAPIPRVTLDPESTRIEVFMPKTDETNKVINFQFGRAKFYKDDRALLNCDTDATLAPSIQVQDPTNIFIKSSKR